jgi:hypothetical protein
MMSNEVYNTLAVTGAAEAIARFRACPFPPQKIGVFGFEDFTETCDAFGYSFHSEWEPPFTWFDEIAAKFPELIFTGSCANDQDEWYATYEGRGGQMTWTESDYKEAFGEA